jgi:sec-independent protein translocase protein TatB
VALIVIGPKDLPGMFRTLGQMTGKARAMASDFSRAMEAAADDSGIGDISKSIRSAANPQKFGLEKAREAAGLSKPKIESDALSPDRQAAKDKINASTAKAAEDRKAREAASAEEDDDLAMAELPDKLPQSKPAMPAKAAAKPASKPAAPVKAKAAKTNSGTKAKAPAKPKVAAEPNAVTKPKTTPAKPKTAKGDA